MKMKKIESKNKTAAIRVRVTESELKLFRFVADTQGIKLSEFMRRAGVMYAEICSEQSEIMESTDESPYEAEKSFHQMFADFNQVTARTITQSHDDLCRQIDDLKIMQDAFLYVLLYHSSEIPLEKKEQAKQSAIRRKAKVLAMIAKTEN